MKKPTPSPSSPLEPIAVVGSGLRFPGGANSPSSLWNLLQKPRDLRQEIGPDRFSTEGFYHHDGTRLGKSNVRHSYLLDEDVRVFDAPFFNISPNEAEAIDPQQRMLLETVYEALEAGGHPLEKLRGSDTSVYVGTMTVDYHDTLVRDHNTIPKYFATGINRAIISNRVSYFFDWHGPSMTIDTACSSSLIAVHQGVQSLRSGESQVSVACGTQVLLGYDMYIGESNLKMLSPNGRSRMWDADADGYARGEGVAAIVMKRLSDAIADGDNIECIIRETGANQDGFSNGITVPSSQAQATLIRQTYNKAGLDPEKNPEDRPQYFEAHGTGTQAGDPREAAAISELFGRHSDNGDSTTPLYVGSIKTIIGHLEGAAGLAGLLKASSSLQQGMIAPNLSFGRLNPKIEPFYHGLEVPTSLKAWPTLPEGVPRRASVNSFGFGGANAHAILEQYIAPTATNNNNQDTALPCFVPFVFSALSETSLVALLERYSQYLAKDSQDINLSSLAWTLHSRKSQLTTRVAFSAATVEQLKAKIDSKLATTKQSNAAPIGTRHRGKSTAANVLGVFTGQGAQWPAMGAELIRSSSFASQRIQALEDSLAALPPADRPAWSLREELLAGADTSRLSEAALSQPLCTAVQIVLVDLLKTAGVTFTAVVGHSSGEIAAAYAAGFLSATDAVRVAYYRGLYARLAGNASNNQKGAMMAVGSSLEEAQELVSSAAFQGRIAIAAHNSAASVTLSGDADAIGELKQLLDEEKKFARLLKVDTAYHSHHMLSCGDAYVAALRRCGVRVNNPNPDACKWYSSVRPSGKPVAADEEELQDEYWRDNMTSAVLFADAVKNATSSHEQLDIALEVGPHPALKGPATQNMRDVRPTPLPYAGVLSRGSYDVEAFAEALGFIWTLLGAKAVDLTSFGKAVSGSSEAQQDGRLIVGLPSYPWDHERVHWVESRRSKKVRGMKHVPHELLGTLSPESNAQDMRWTNILRASEISWMQHHQLQGITVFPAAGYVAMAVEACRSLAGDKQVELYELHNLAIPRAITFEEGDTSGVEIMVSLTGIEHDENTDTTTANVAIYSAPIVNNTKSSNHDMELVASASVKILLGHPHTAALPGAEAAAPQNNLIEVDSDRVYSMFAELGYGYTGPFRGLSSTRRKLGHAAALVDAYAYSDDESTFYLVHPSMLDVAIQSSMLAYASPNDQRLWSLHVPTKIGMIRVNPEICHALSTSGATVPISTTLSNDADDFSASIDIFGQDGEHGMIQVQDLVLKPFAPATEAEDRWMYSSTHLGVATPDATIAAAVLAKNAMPAESSDDALTTCRAVLAGLVKQITYRYPHARILEIDATAGGVTGFVMDAVSSHGGTVPAYTYTAPSTDTLKMAEDEFKTYKDNMVFKVLDLEQDIATQGFEPQSYDIIVASNTQHTAQAILQTALENIRTLVKPGGYLVLLAPTGSPSTGTPNTMSPVAWHSKLRQAGFSGIDTMSPPPKANEPFTVMATQAVDDQIRFLQRPLSSPWSHVHIESLVILGTGSLESVRIAEQVSEMLHRFCDKITILDTLPTEDDAPTLDPSSTFVNLVDLDAPIFKDMTQDKMQGLKQVFELARHVLWLTCGAHVGHEPYHAASLAFCRSLAHEVTHASVATLDVLEMDDALPKIIAEQLLRQCALDEWDGDGQQCLWSKEPEMCLRDGKLHILRILPSLDKNARLNAGRRAISKTVPALTSNVSIVCDAANSSMPYLVQDVLPPTVRGDNMKELVTVASSSLAAIAVAQDTALFVGIGSSTDTDAAGALRVTLSTANSRTTVPITSVAVPNNVTNKNGLLVAVVNELLAASAVEALPPKSSLLVHCTARDRFFAEALSRRAASMNIPVAFSCTDTAQDQKEEINASSSWIILSQRAPRHVIRRELQLVRPTHFLDMTPALHTQEGAAVSGVSLNIAQALPRECKLIPCGYLAQRQASLSQCLDPTAISNRLQDAVTSATASFVDLKMVPNQGNILQLDQIHEPSTPHQATSVVHWPAAGNVEVRVRPMTGKMLFAKDKTYILFGLSGQVGQSLCEWMVANGAGCVCLTSRRPNVDQVWLDGFRGPATSVKVMAADITDKASLEGVINTIRETCPPIAGIVNGANVLSDAPFSSMSVEMMRQALGPKIDGSLHLDQAFYNDDLDFFIMLSSISCVIGTAGQSNYVAANGFMNGLARQRRSRGLAASAFDIGLILGIGLAEIAGQGVVDSLQKYGITPLSEPDLRLAFAESIHAGYARPEDDAHANAVPSAVMTTGLRTITSEETNIVWYNDPIFSHLVMETKAADGADQSKSKAVALPIKEQIANAATVDDAFLALKESFAAKLGMLLQSAGQAIAHDTPLVELGVDSLVAVEVRSWFLKALKVDVPVLKVVGGSSLHDICQLAMKKLPEELLAQIGNAQSGNASLGSGPSVPRISAPTPIKPTANSTATAPPPQKMQRESRSSSGSSSSSSSTSAKSSAGIQTPTSPVETPAETPASTVKGMSLKSHTHLKTNNSSAALANVTSSSRAFVKTEPISVGQARFWFLRLLVEDPTTFNIALRFRMNGTVRVGDLERALRLVTARHDSLRTCFIADLDEADQATQRVLARSQIKLERVSVSSEEEVVTQYEKLLTHEFDLATGPLLRLMLVTQSPSCHYLLVNYHHIIMDMASFQVLTSELEKAYNGQPLGPPPRQYPDFSAAQHQALENGVLNDELKFWQGVFPAGQQPPVLSLLPMARSSSRAALTNYAIHQVGIRLDPAVAARVKAVSKAQRATPFHFYLAAFKAMLFSFVEDQELTIGIADANRHDSDVLGSIGFFLNLLTLRFRRQPQQVFSNAIVEAQKTAYAALEHSRLPFDVLLKELGVARSPAHSPFFQTFFDYRQQTSDKERWLNCSFDLEEMNPGRTAYDISLDVADLGSQVHVTLRAQQQLYDLTAVNLLLETYTHFVTTLSQDVSLTLEATPLFSEKQLARAVQVGVGPDMTSSWPSTLPHRIDQVAHQNPDEIALADGLGSRLTYRAMMQRIEAIAEALLQRTKKEAGAAAAGPGSRVLVFQQASTDWICSLLAIMRIGWVYVPLDLRNPISRLAAQAQHCQPVAVLADATTAADAPQLHASSVVIDVSRVGTNPAAPVANTADPDSPAAILYTSGSTGTPKGIMIRHAGMQNQMEGYTKTYKLGAERVLQQSAFTFDFSIDQIFTALVNGGMLYIVPSSKRGDPLSITEIMREQAITYTKVTPSEYSMWMQYGSDNLRHASDWRFAFGGGEPLTHNILRQFADLGLPNLALHNSYGPAEISIASHKGLVDYMAMTVGSSSNNPSRDSGQVPCGTSLPNYATYIMDKDLNPLPAGMPGEVVIGGPGVSLGYLSNKDLTKRVYVPNPHATPRQRANGWTQMHRTGDVGRLQDDGTLIFHNRIAGDTQVKLRGLRIDLQDIENNIVATAGGVLKEAVVTLRDGDPDYLVAHVVFASQHNETMAEKQQHTFLEHLLGRLPIPQYMIPVLAVPLDKLPLSRHSKVDRKAIKNLDLPARLANDAADKDNDNADDGEELRETMNRLRQLWHEVLPNIEKLGLAVTPATSFFLIGGNSLLIVRLQAKIRRVFNVVVRLADLLGAHTLRGMARKIDESSGVDMIDWSLETMPPLMPRFLKDLSPKQESQAKTVLLTGATGNMAKHVLPLLLADDRVGKVHCVVRDKPERGEQLVHPKVVHHFGDLTLHILGLGVDEFRDLAEHVDVILHMGAVRSFWDNYHMLRAANVHPTKELVKLAAARKIPIHFISTSGVLPRDVLQTGEASSAAAYEPSVDGSNGYIASKWASETLLEHAAAGPLAVPSYIYRMLPAAAVQTQGQTDDAKRRVIDEFLRCIDLAKAAPDTTGWKGRIDLIPAKLVAEWLCSSVLASVSASKAVKNPTAQFLHYQSPISVDVEELTALIEQRKSDTPLERLPILKWMGRIKALGFSYILASQDATVESETGDAKLTSRR